MFNCTAHSEFTRPDVVGVTANGLGVTTWQSGFAGGAHPTPRNPTLPRGRSRPRVGAHNAASLPSNLRSKSAVAKVISPPEPIVAPAPSLNSSKIVGSVPSPIRQLQPTAAVWLPINTPNVVSAARAASDRFVSHNPGGFNGSSPPIEKPVITALLGSPSRSIRQNSNRKIPLPDGRGGHPTLMPVFGSTVNRRSVGPS